MESVAPFSPLTSLFYYDLTRFADVVVRVPEGEYSAVVEKKTPVLQPSLWRWRKNEIVFGVCLTGYVLWRLKKRVFYGSHSNASEKGEVTRFVNARRNARQLLRFLKK